MDTPPSGTVTFLFTDIEGSTLLLERLGPAWGATLDAHHNLLRAAIEGAGGQQVNTSGDAVFAVFARPPDAVAAAVAAQRALASADWAEGARLRVRMGLHTGEAERAGQDYAGLDVHRAARISAAASGGQVLLSSATRLLAERALPEGVRLRDLGEHRLKDLSGRSTFTSCASRDCPRSSLRPARSTRGGTLSPRSRRASSGASARWPRRWSCWTGRAP